jgi:hypothetical protein
MTKHGKEANPHLRDQLRLMLEDEKVSRAHRLNKQLAPSHQDRHPIALLRQGHTRLVQRTLSLRSDDMHAAVVL